MLPGSPKRGKVLVVDDRLRARRILVEELRDAGFEVCEANDGAMGWQEFTQQKPDAVLTDMVMPKSDGIELLTRIRAVSEVPVILFTAHGSPQAATSAMKAGADDFVCSPDIEIDELVSMVADAIAGTRPSDSLPGLEERFVGASGSITRLRQRISGLAPLRVPVLVSGAAGTGVTTTVHALHELGSTAGGKLIQLDRKRPLPSDGSAPDAIYLDGIDQFGPDALQHWARVLETSAATDFRQSPRIFASTTEAISALSFQDDFSGGVGRTLLRFPIDLPKLSDIAEDIPAIAASIVARASAQLGRPIRLSPAASTLVAGRSWTGNGAQLQRTLERAVGFTRGRQIRRETIEEELRDREMSLDQIRARATARERQELIGALERTGGNVSSTAEILGKSRAAVYRLMEKYDVPLERRR